ncbi:hypothetical protein LVB87_06130 [Lysobacter sp. KIS68-7]|uniref:hypothetical protein n=1 Tax=Lysobacter sp. KIS68-7 TaxID=2904252 RepID=UPI001E47E5DA|nr:hypothetical protein [Lysobacter sp. KIS68-7]UHQ20717.1 hypothetical protein LVB87_06130 [Lysobacter sp. KIS68-7]
MYSPYSVQHVLWRGAMALSLLAVGGVGAVSVPQQKQASINECHKAPATHSAPVTPAVPSAAKQAPSNFRYVTFDTIVVVAHPSKEA